MSIKICHIFIIVLLLCIGCEEVPLKDSVFTIPIDITKKYPSVDIQIKRIIPLELTKESAFKRAHKVIESPLNYFVMDRSENKIYIFDKDGHFQVSIDRKGNGPGEYTTITDINIDPYSRSLHILDPRGKFIGLSLDDFSTVTDEILFQGVRNVTNFQLLNEDLIVMYSFAYVGEKTIRFYSRKEDKFVKEMLESNVVDTKGAMTFGMSPFRVWNNTLKYTDINTYYSYEITGTTLDPEIYIDVGKNSFDFKTIAGQDYTYDIFNHIYENNKAFPISIIFENDDYLAFGIYYDNALRTYIVKKSNRSIFKLNLPEYPSNMMDFLTICNGLHMDKFRGIVSNPGMAEHIFEYALYDESIGNQISKLKSGDNPVIFEYELKF